MTFATAYEIIVGTVLATIGLLSLIAYRKEGAKCTQRFLTAIKNALS
jgi:hypothetical protein